MKATLCVCCGSVDGLDSTIQSCLHTGRLLGVCAACDDAQERMADSGDVIAAVRQAVRACRDYAERTRTPTHARFWAKVRVLSAPDACWEWIGYCQPAHQRADGRAILGYGQYRANGGMHKAHVVAFTFEHGPVPSSRVVGHTCDNPSCVRPSHLRAISRSENMRQMHARKRHPGFAKKDDNVYR